MTTRLDKALDALHEISGAVAKATRRRRRIRREHIETAVNVASVVTSAVATAVPQARPVAGVLGALQSVAPRRATVPREEITLLTRVQAVEGRLQTATGEQKTRLEAQRDMLLSLIQEQEQQR